MNTYECDSLQLGGVVVGRHLIYVCGIFNLHALRYDILAQGLQAGQLQFVCFCNLQSRVLNLNKKVKNNF